MIPVAEQIDAFLDGRLDRLVDRDCGGDANVLPTRWTVGADALFDAASARGLETFVVAAPSRDGCWLVALGRDWQVIHLERGLPSPVRRYRTLEAGVRGWIEEHLRIAGLPVITGTPR